MIGVWSNNQQNSNSKNKDSPALYKRPGGAHIHEFHHQLHPQHHDVIIKVTDQKSLFCFFIFILSACHGQLVLNSH